MAAKFDPAKHHRRSIRLKGHDYSRPGAYFVTICSHQRENLFGQVQDERMQTNRLGQIVQKAWLDLPCHYPHVQLDSFCLMPNHVNAIIVLVGDDRSVGGGPDDPMARHGLPEIVRAFKSFSARRINAVLGRPGNPVWQRNYYEHIIRNQDDWQRIRDYIIANPARWDSDRVYRPRRANR
jgi:putative transposase